MYVNTRKKDMADRERIWYNDVPVLVKNYSSFWPHRDQTPSEQVNSLVRLLIYITVASFAYNWQISTLIIGGAVIALVSLAGRGQDVYKLAGLDGGYSTACKKPTKDNPFMNRLATELGKEQPPPCDPNSVEPQIREYFNAGLPRNIEDIYERQNSQREFYTVVNGGSPPDTTAFAKFLYGTSKNCKTNPLHCTGFN